MRLTTSLKVSLTALMSSLAAAFQVAGLEIPFPLLPFLKYDPVGVPIILVSLIVGIKGGIVADLLTAVAIMFRGDIVGAWMKFLAELTTFVPFTLAFRKLSESRIRYIGSTAIGVISRVMLMNVANIVVCPIVFKIPLSVALSWIPLISFFNATIALMYIPVSLYLYKLAKKVLEE